jgi:hypothetical protein
MHKAAIKSERVARRYVFTARTAQYLDAGCNKKALTGLFITTSPVKPAQHEGKRRTLRIRVAP